MMMNSFPLLSRSVGHRHLGRRPFAKQLSASVDSTLSFSFDCTMSFPFTTRLFFTPRRTFVGCCNLEKKITEARRLDEDTEPETQPRLAGYLAAKHTFWHHVHFSPPTQTLTMLTHSLFGTISHLSHELGSSKNPVLSSRDHDYEDDNEREEKSLERLVSLDKVCWWRWWWLFSFPSIWFLFFVGR
ncbi:hypothetical protein F4778DRAFT_742378 [Xylariomycetidae sp. FL2044]|nr:hypothetical protein F4778DRAFT_742378 [Xylariomycetidae sp. FL2044]